MPISFESGLSLDDLYDQISRSISLVNFNGKTFPQIKDKEFFKVNKRAPTAQLLEEIDNFQKMEIDLELCNNVSLTRGIKLIGYTPKSARKKLAIDQTLKDLFIQNIATSLTEHVVNTTDLCDKIFASCWVDSQNILFGSKDNKLTLLNLDCDRLTNITIGCREFTLTLDFDGNVSNVHNRPVSEHQLLSINGCGIHSIHTSPDQQFIATTGQLPSDLCIYDRKSIHPLYLVHGHTDWIFDLKWINHDWLVTGCRNGELGFFNVNKFAAKGNIISTKQLIRSIEVGTRQNLLFTTNCKGEVWQYDLKNPEHSQHFDVPDKTETVCMAYEPNLGILAIGSKDNVMMFDTRAKFKPVQIIPNKQDCWGTRSISWYGSHLTLTGGLGRIAFYDIRNHDFIELNENYNSKHFYQCSSAWIREDQSFISLSEILGYNVPTSIYTHSYNGKKLFVGGGPTQFGIYGCYAGVLYF